MDISPWLDCSLHSSPKGQERGEKNVGSQLCLSLHLSEKDCVPPGTCPPAGSWVPGAWEHIIYRACHLRDHPALRHPQCTAIAQQDFWSSLLLNSLCHNSVYVGPHQSQVLINLCLQRAKGDWVNQASSRQNHPDTWTSLCGQTYLVLVIYNGESKHRHDSWGEKEHTVIFLPSRFLQRTDLLQTATNTYHATWSADPPGIFVLKINFAQTSHIWNFPLLWD